MLHQVSDSKKLFFIVYTLCGKNGIIFTNLSKKLNVIWLIWNKNIRGKKWTRQK